ncbi:MAG: hypothetical protein WC651_02315 [Candidatus Gracilibacteria bacterium]|jgi:hypothetical protein
MENLTRTIAAVALTVGLGGGCTSAQQKESRDLLGQCEEAIEVQNRRIEAVLPEVGQEAIRVHNQGTPAKIDDDLCPREGETLRCIEDNKDLPAQATCITGRANADSSGGTSPQDPVPEHDAVTYFTLDQCVTALEERSKVHETLEAIRANLQELADQYAQKLRDRIEKAK